MTCRVSCCDMHICTCHMLYMCMCMCMCMHMCYASVDACAVRDLPRDFVQLRACIICRVCVCSIKGWDGRVATRDNNHNALVVTRRRRSIPQTFH